MCIRDSILKLEVTLGEMGTVVRQVAQIVDSVNKDYLEILKLTGPSPDKYRDYGFGRVLPDVVEDLVLQSMALTNVVDYIEGMANIKSQNSSTLETAARYCRLMGTNEDEIAKNLSNLKNQVSTLRCV